MPLPSDEKVVETSKGLVETLHSIFGPHPGYRPGKLYPPESCVLWASHFQLSQRAHAHLREAAGHC